jgi:hypothetical protein
MMDRKNKDDKIMRKILVLFFTSFFVVAFQGWPTHISGNIPSLPITGVSSPEIYTDPTGLFTLPIPNGWQVVNGLNYGLLTNADATIKVYVLSLQNTEISNGIAAAWEIVNPTFNYYPLTVFQNLPAGGVEQALTITYDSGDSQRGLAGFGQLYKGRVYVVLIDGSTDALIQQTSQINAIKTGFTITGINNATPPYNQPLWYKGQIAAINNANL